MRWLLLGPLLGVAALAVACSNPPTPTPTATPTPVVTPSPPPPGTLRVAMTGAQSHMDVQQNVSEWATLFGPGVAYSRLLRFTSGPDVALPSMRVECDLCTSWETLDDRTYVFQLDPQARWHDVAPVSGRPVTADDVVFSLERLRSEEGPNAVLLDAVDTIVAVNETTIRLALRYPDADLPQKLANPHAVIVAREVVEGNGLRIEPVIGSGPWTMQRLRSGQVNFDVVEDYRKAGVPAVGHVIMTPVGGFGATASSVLDGEIDVAQITEEDWLMLREAGFLSALTPRQGIGAVLAVNTQRPPFDGLDMRRTLFLALDPQAGREQVWGATAYSAMGVPVVEADWLLPPERFASYFAQQDEARWLLEAASPSAGRITLTVANFGQQYLDYGDVVAGQLREVGFDVTVEVLSRANYLTNVWRNREFQVFVGPLPPTSTTNGFLLSLLHSQGQWNITGATDAELDRLIEAQSVESDVQARGVLIRRIQEHVLSQGLLVMPAITVERWAYSPRVTGFHPNLAGGQGSFWEHVGITEDEP